MSNTQNSKLPKIMLPVAMIVASLVSNLPSTLYNMISPVLVSNVGLPFAGMPIVGNIVSILGTIAYPVVLILFSLCCKGLVKKLWFIMSVYVGGIANIVLYFCSFVLSIIFMLVPSGEIYLQTTIYGIITAAGGFLSTALEIVVAFLFFNMITKYTEKDISVEGMEPYKLKPVLPGIMIAVCGVIISITGIACNLISKWLTLKFCSGTWDRISVIQAFNMFITLVMWVTIIIAALFIKGKYQKLTFVGSVVAGRGLWSVTGSIQNIVTNIAPHFEYVFLILFGILFLVLGVVTGVIIFYILNKKEHVKIKPELDITEA